MPALSYNEEQHQALALRHFFLPPRYAFVAEAVIAIVALIIFNLSALSDRLGGTEAGIDVSPLTLWGRIFNDLLGATQQYAIVQQIMLFLLWAFVGALLYILVFRFIQIFILTRGTVRQGVHLIQTEHAQGAARWFASLHDFFLKAIIIVLGGIAVLTGFLVCFGIASQELNNGLSGSFPGNMGHYLISLVSAVIAVRIIVIGICLLSPRFRIWYNS